MRLLALVVCLALCACPPPVIPDAGPTDSGTVEEDAGSDAGIDAGRDAGRPPRPDAGVDAGWVNVPESEWCRSLAYAKCWRDIRCLRIDETRIADCVARNLVGCDSSVYTLGSSLGLHRYDGDAGARCLNAYDTGSCERVPDECSRVFTGLVPADGGAFLKEDCDPDAGYFYGSENICPRRCKPWSRLGEPCFDSTGQYSSSCQPGVHSCDYEDAGSSTTVCVPLQNEGDGCRWFYGCGPNLTCASGRCVKQIAHEGERCEEPGLFYPNCDGETFCRLPPPLTPGGPVPDAGVCMRRAALGGACVGFYVDYVQTCMSSLRCSSNIGTGTCLARAGVGQPCSSTNSSGFYPNDCMDGLYCDYATSRCRELPGDGGDCSSRGSGNVCKPGFWCDYFEAERCYPVQGDGEDCEGSDLRCASGDCQYGMLPDAGNGWRCVRCASRDAG